MSYDIKELTALSEQDKKEIIAELMDSIVLHSEDNLPEWKTQLYKERLDYYMRHKSEGAEWKELRKKYFSE